MREIDDLRTYVHENVVRLADGVEVFGLDSSPSMVMELVDRIEFEVERIEAELDVERTHLGPGPEWIEMPKDSKGEYVHVGDMMVNGDGEMFEVSSIDFGRHPHEGEGTFWLAWSEDAEFDEPTWALRHHKGDTVDSLLHNLVNLCHKVSNRPYTDGWSVDEVVDSGNFKDIAAKLRLADDAE